MATEENEATKEAEVDGNVGDRVGAFLVGWMVNIFFLARRRTLELEARRFSLGACFNVSF